MAGFEHVGKNRVKFAKQLHILVMQETFSWLISTMHALHADEDLIL